jgi:hypothetical protein
MIPPTVFATILFLAILTAGIVLGFAVTTMAFGAQLPAIKEREYTRGFFKGLETARANHIHDIIANDTATTRERRRA